MLADNVQLFSTNLPNLDGMYNVNEEYNTNISVNLPAGNHLIIITNTGNDWFYLDWVQLNQVLPATYAANWQPSPAAIGLRDSHESLLYVVSPDAAFSAGATNATLPLQHGQMVIMTNWPAGNFLPNGMTRPVSFSRNDGSCHDQRQPYASAGGFFRGLGWDRLSTTDADLIWFGRHAHLSIRV